MDGWAAKIGRRGAGVVSLLALALLVVMAGTAVAAPAVGQGRVDASFGQDGRTLTRVPPPTQEEGSGPTKFGMSAGPHGEIFVFDGQAIAAYSARGVPNRHFGRGGLLALDTGIGPGFAVAAVAIDSHGRMVVAGTSTVAVPGVSGVGSLATVRRYLADGNPDQSFGSDGTITGDLGLPLVRSWACCTGATAVQVAPEMTVTGLTIDAHDRPVLTGSARTVATACDLVPMLASEGFVARLTPQGTADREFGGTGSVLLGGSWSRVLHPAIAHAGGIAVTVSSDQCRSPHIQALAMVGGNGGLDPSFGTGGLSPVGFGSVAALTVDRSDRVLLFGERWTEGAYGEGEGPFTKLARVLPSAAADSAFRKRGSTEIALPVQGAFTALAVDGRNRPLLAGWSISGKGQKRFAVERLTTGGKADPRFGRHGLATIGFGRRTNAEAQAILVDSQDRLVLGGIVKNATGSAKNRVSFGLVRYLTPR